MIPTPAFFVLGVLLAALSPKKKAIVEVDPKPNDDLPTDPAPKPKPNRKLVRETQIVREYVRAKPRRRSKLVDDPKPTGDSPSGDPPEEISDPPTT